MCWVWDVVVFVSYQLGLHRCLLFFLEFLLTDMLQYNSHHITAWLSHVLLSFVCVFFFWIEWAKSAGVHDWSCATCGANKWTSWGPGPRILKLAFTPQTLYLYSKSWYIWWQQKLFNWWHIMLTITQGDFRDLQMGHWTPARGQMGRGFMDVHFFMSLKRNQPVKRPLTLETQHVTPKQSTAMMSLGEDSLVKCENTWAKTPWPHGMYRSRGVTRLIRELDQLQRPELRWSCRALRVCCIDADCYRMNKLPARGVGSAEYKSRHESWNRPHRHAKE